MSWLCQNSLYGPGATCLVSQVLRLRACGITPGFFLDLMRQSRPLTLSVAKGDLEPLILLLSFLFSAEVTGTATMSSLWALSWKTRHMWLSTHSVWQSRLYLQESKRAGILNNTELVLLFNKRAGIWNKPLIPAFLRISVRSDHPGLHSEIGLETNKKTINNNNKAQDSGLLPSCPVLMLHARFRVSTKVLTGGPFKQ